MTFNPTEKHQSQIPALQLLVALGFTPLSQKETLALRGDRLSNVLLDDILADQLLKINRFAHRGREYHFDLEDAHEAIRRLRPRPDKAKGLRGTNQEVYYLLVLGTTITQRIGGDTKSYSFRYIDWEDPASNVYHVTAEMAVERTGSVKTRRCDVVAFVNGIPFVVAENKRPTEKSEKAGSQLIGYQKEHNIPHLFHFAQLLLALNRQDGRYATVGTAAKFWQGWLTSMPRAAEGPSITTDAPPPPPPHTTPSPLQRLVNRPLAVTEARAVYSGDFAHARSYFDALGAEGSRSVTIQDRTIHALCRPERLLDLVRRFTVFDGGVRKIARHQQYFAVHRAMERVKHFDLHGRRKGGVIWHTQGSGKSLTMVMLGRALALDHEIVNPRIIIVTDRRDLDRQIKGTFKSCDMEPVRARSGRHLLQLIRDRTPLVTTIVNKLETALRHARKSDHDPNIFVLVDESHRSHTGRHGRQGLHGGHSQLGKSMRRLLPKACYLGFTGTPLLSREKSTFATFGGLIHQYAIDQAVEDGAVVPLLYEGRLVDQQVTAGVVTPTDVIQDVPVIPSLDEQNTSTRRPRWQSHGPLSDLDALLGRGGQVRCAVLHRPNSVVGPLKPNQHSVQVLCGAGRLRESAYAVPTVSRRQDLDTIPVGGTEDHLPHGGLDGMVDAVFGLVDDQKPLSGVGQRQCDAEQANCPVAQTLERDRPFAALQPDCDSPSVLAATSTPKHGHALHLVAEDEVEGRHREILLFGERDVVPKACRVFGRQRFGADGFAFCSWGKTVPVVEEQGPEIERCPCPSAIVHCGRETFASLDELSQRQAVTHRCVEPDGVEHRGLPHSVAAREKGHAAQTRDGKLADPAKTVNLEISQLQRAGCCVSGIGETPNPLSRR